MAVNGKNFHFSSAGKAKLSEWNKRLVSVSAYAPGAEAVKVENMAHHAAKVKYEKAIADAGSAFLVAHGYKWNGLVEKKIPGL